MSVNKLGLILFSGFLVFAMAPVAPAQSTQNQTQDQTKKQTEKKGTTKTETGKTTQKKTETERKTQTDQQTTDQKAQTEKKGGTTATGKAGAKKAKKTSSVSQDKVRQAQMALKNEGFDPGPIDGIMGPMTMTALRNYQSHNQLQVTGTLTPETENALLQGATAGTTRRGSLSPRSSNDQNQQPTYGQQQPYSQTQQQPYNEADQQPNPQNDQQTSGDISSQTQPQTGQTQQSTTESEYSTRESSGANSQAAVSDVEDVKQIQQQLADLQYDPGEINGMMSAQTQQAIREFQYLNNLPVTGTLDEQTKIALDTQWRGGVETAKAGETPLSTERQKPETDSSTQNCNDQYNQNRTETTPSRSDTYSKDQTTNKDNTYSQDRSAKAHDRGAGKSDKDAADRISKSAAVLQDLTASADKRIPNALLERAEAIAVIPHMIKGAFGIGGRYGKGVVAQRTDSGRWSAPAFLEIGGGSFGAQIGGSATDLVLIFTDRKALEKLEGGKDLKLGVDAGVVAGPIGREAEAGVNATLKSGIYAYSRSKGLFAGVALDGAVLSMDNDMNRKVYGESADAKQVLEGKVAMNSTVKPFTDALEKAVPKKRISQK